MSRTENSEALSVISAAVRETHDGLAQFTQKLKAIDEIPSFWWQDHPVWVCRNNAESISSWPIQNDSPGKLCAVSGEGDIAFSFQISTFQDFCKNFFETPLSDTEFVLFADLATGLSIENSAAGAGVATSTRRKQLQSCFRKLRVASQAELVSLANRITQRFTTILSAHLGPADNEWSAYAHFLPDRVRCGVIGGSTHRPVRYLEIGPVTGKPVIVLHPMMFPSIDDDDVDCLYDIGWRAIWPIREGCLSSRNLAATNWNQHCAQTIADIHTIQKMCSDGPVPIIALVSSGAYATRFAASHPECVERIDYVSTCFSAGKGKSRDVYFGDFLLRNLRHNGRMAVVAVQHIAGVMFNKNQLEPTLKRIFRGSAADQEALRQEFSNDIRAERAKYAVQSSIDSIRYDYLSQLSFNWASADQAKAEKQFWHGAQDRVHKPNDISKLSERVSGKKANMIPDMGHLTQGAPLREVFRQIASTYSK